MAARAVKRPRAQLRLFQASSSRHELACRARARRIRGGNDDDDGEEEAPGASAAAHGRPARSFRSGGGEATMSSRAAAAGAAAGVERGGLPRPRPSGPRPGTPTPAGSSGGGGGWGGSGAASASPAECNWWGGGWPQQQEQQAATPRRKACRGGRGAVPPRVPTGKGNRELVRRALSPPAARGVLRRWSFRPAPSRLRNVSSPPAPPAQCSRPS